MSEKVHSEYIDVVVQLCTEKENIHNKKWLLTVVFVLVFTELSIDTIVHIVTEISILYGHVT